MVYHALIADSSWEITIIYERFLMPSRQACTTQKARRAKSSTKICRGPQSFI